MPRTAEATSPAARDGSGTQDVIDLLDAGAAVPRHRQLLIVEDSKADADLVAECFEHPRTGSFTIARAERLDEAVSRLSRHRFDCVILDLSLPDARGLEAVRAVLQASRGMVPVIVLTGLRDYAVGEAAVELGAQDFLLKAELNASTLPRSVLYAIERHRQQEALRRAHARLVEENEQRQRAQRQLWGSQDRLAAALDTVSDTIVVIDADCRLHALSPSAAGLLGQHAPAILNVEVLGLVHPDDVGSAESIREAVASGGADAPLEIRLLARDGSWRAVPVSVNHRAEDPSAPQVVLGVHDVADLPGPGEIAVLLSGMPEQITVRLATPIPTEKLELLTPMERYAVTERVIRGRPAKVVAAELHINRNRVYQIVATARKKMGLGHGSGSPATPDR